MPISPENLKRYPPNWKEIRERIRERAHDKCETCGAVNHAWINKYTREICTRDEDDVILVVCTVAHLDNTPENCEDENLKFLCQRCHNRYDMPFRVANRRAKRMIGQITLDL